MKSRHIRGLSMPRIRPSGAGARAVATERMRDIRIVGESEKADYLLIKPEDLDEMIEDAVAAIAYARSRGEEFVPIAVVDRLLAGENPVKVWRQHRGLTLSALADAADMGKGYLSQIESGERKGTVATLKKLATVLAVDLDDLTTAVRSAMPPERP